MFGTPKHQTSYKQKKTTTKQIDEQSISSNEQLLINSNSKLVDITNVLEYNYKSFIKVMYEVYKYEKDPDLQNRQFQIIKKSSSQDNDDKIDLNKDYFKEFEEEILAFILIATFDEHHNFFIKFYSYFDEDQNFKLEKDETEKILNFMALETQMGKDKVEYLIEQLLKQIKNESDTFQLKLLQKQLPNQLSQELKDKFFKLYVSSNSSNQDNKCLDLKKFFGVLLGFSFQFTRKRIQNRIFEWDKIRGIDNIQGFKTQITGMMTLSYALKRVTGLDYLNKLDRNSKQVSYRHIEQILQAYKNANNEIELQTIQRVLSDIEKYMKVDPQTKVEFKKIKMYKLIDYVSMRIAFHKCCQQITNDKSSNKFNFTEEIILWNSCNAKNMLKQNKVETSVLKFLEKNQTQNELDFDIHYTLNEYLKQKFSNLQRSSRERIIDNIVSQNPKQFQIPSLVYKELIYEAQYKIKFYIMKVFSGFGNKISEQIQTDFLKQRQALKWTVQLESNQQIFAPPKQQNSTFKGSKFQQQALQQKMKEGQMADEDEDQNSQKDVEQSSEIQRSKIKFQERQSTINLQQQSGSYIQSDKRGLSSIQFQNHSNRGGDILNACFMMEGLLEKVQYMKKDEIKKLKKQNIQGKVNTSDDYDEHRKSEERNSMKIPSTSNIQQKGLPTSGSVLPKSSFTQQRGSQQTIGSRLYGNTYNKQYESPIILEDLRRIQPDDYQDDILDQISVIDNDQIDKQELMNNSVIALMMMNNQKYQRRTEYQNRFPMNQNGSQDQILEDKDDFQIKKASSFKKSILIQSNFNQSQNIQTDLFQPKINKDVFVEVRRQQAIDRLSYYQQLQKQQQENNLKENPQQQKEKNSSATDRTCSNCSIF